MFSFRNKTVIIYALIADLILCTMSFIGSSFDLWEAIILVIVMYPFCFIVAQLINVFVISSDGLSDPSNQKQQSISQGSAQEENPRESAIGGQKVELHDHLKGLSEQPAQKAESNPELEAQLEMLTQQLFSSGYYQSILELPDLIAGQKVLDVQVGENGFALLMENGKWVVEYVLEGQMQYKIVSDEQDHINSLICLNEDSENSDGKNETEVKKVIGETLDAVSIGNNTFNFCFDNCWELEAFVIKDHGEGRTFGVYLSNWNSE